jgi:D-lactate dehydrogenase
VLAEPGRRLTPASAQILLRDMRAIVGQRHLLTDDSATRRYRTGYRFGAGSVFAVVRPGSLVEQWRLVEICAAAGVILLFQATNTGLTGGSTPDGDDYDRDIVLVSTKRIATVHLIDSGRQVICLPGSTLDQLERILTPLGREPHSVIGSSCIGASVIGGICNNSGGSLVRRGPAYTELSLFARIGADGRAELVNHLDIGLGSEPEEMLRCLERGAFDATDIVQDSRRRASDHGYEERVRAVDAPTPARYNADPGRLFEAAGSAGRLAVFAVRLDTFSKPGKTATFYIGTNDPAELMQLRRDMLQGGSLPIAAEYMDRAAFDIAERYGKDVFLAIRWLGTQRLGWLFAAKARFDALTAKMGQSAKGWSDRLLQFVADRTPRHLPPPLYAYRDRYEHHLMLRVCDEDIEPTRLMLTRRYPSSAGDAFECTAREGKLAFLHRFAAASAAVRYRAIHAYEVEDIVALDVALPRNSVDWVEKLPPETEARLVRKLYYGHFFCYVFHQDYIAARGQDVIALEHEICSLLDQRGARYPAEHNVGHVYAASDDQVAFFHTLDPGNRLNPGIGKTSKRADWA